MPFTLYWMEKGGWSYKIFKNGSIEVLPLFGQNVQVSC